MDQVTARSLAKRMGLRVTYALLAPGRVGLATGRGTVFNVEMAPYALIHDFVC